MPNRVRWIPYKGIMDAAEQQRVMGTSLGRIGDTIIAWVNEGDIHCFGENLATAEIEDRALAKALAPFYLRNDVAVAKACDELLDRSGRLLGYVREAAGRGQ